MKIITWYIVLLSSLFLNANVFALNLAAKTNPIGVEVSIGSIGGEFDVTAYKALRKAIGENVKNEILDKFLIYGYGIEGGFSGCVEAAPGMAISSRFSKFLTKLAAIKPKTGTTFYFKRVLNCPNLPVVGNQPTTVKIAKADGSLACEPNSGISLSKMQEELKGIQIYSAHKLADGLIRPAVCGIPTGMFNVYEIATSDLENALTRGFIEWKKISTDPQAENAVTLSPKGLVTYQCISVVVRGTNFCYKYRTSPPPKTYIRSYLGACPKKPPSNCP